MSVSQRSIAVLLMSIGKPDSIELTHPAALVHTLDSLFTAHESSLCPTS
jgi:hypothetical protein